MIEIDEGFFVFPDKVAVVKAQGKKACSLFLDHANPVDGGFLLKRPALEVVQEIVNALYGDEDDSEDQSEDDE